MLRGKGGAVSSSVSLAVSLHLCVCVARPCLAATAYEGQPSASGDSTSTVRGREGRRRRKFHPQRLGSSPQPEKRRLSSIPPSRGRFVAADSSAIHTRRLRKGTTRRFQEVIYVTERAGATGNEDILSVHSDVHAQAMLQAQDLVLGFARFLGGSFAGSRAAGVSTDASRDLTSTKTSGPARGRQRPRRREPQIAGRTNQTQQGKASHVAASPRSNSISDRRALALPLAREQGSLPYWRI